MSTVWMIYQSSYKWVSIFIWVVLVLSIDPYECWALLYFSILTLAMLYDYLHSLPNNYHLLEGLRYLSIWYNEPTFEASTCL